MSLTIGSDGRVAAARGYLHEPSHLAPKACPSGYVCVPIPAGPGPEADVAWAEVEFERSLVVDENGTWFWAWTHRGEVYF